MNCFRDLEKGDFPTKSRRDLSFMNRFRDLEKKKEIFRRKVEERRADMQNMTVEEKEDFLFKLRLVQSINRTN